MHFQEEKVYVSTRDGEGSSPRCVTKENTEAKDDNEKVE
jgi:hypothetical protein